MTLKEKKIVPMSVPLFENEPIPENGLMDVSDKPDFRVELSSDLTWERPKFE